MRPDDRNGETERNRFVPVFQPADPVQIAAVKVALEGSGIPYYLDNENYLAATALPFSLGAMKVTVLVPEDRAVEALEILKEWFEEGVS